LAPHFGVPQIADRVEGEAERVPMSLAPHLGREITTTGERVAVGDCAVRSGTDNLPQARSQILRWLDLLPLARGDEEILPSLRGGDINPYIIGAWTFDRCGFARG
jgi:hypothetical protein